MKKTITLLLTLALVLALCACGQSGNTGSIPAPAAATEEPAAEPAEEPVAEPVEEAAAEPAEEPTEEPTEEPVEEPAVEPTEEPAAAESDAEALPLGEITETETGIHYENAELGIACDLDKNWYVYSEEEMAQLAGITADKFKGSNYEELMKNSNVFYDFFASRIDGLATINVNFSYTGSTLGVDIEKYLDFMLPQMKTMIESSGMTDVVVEKNTVTFAGSERSGILIHAKTEGIDYFAQQVYFTVGPRISTLTMGTFLEDTTADLVALFQPVG